MSQQLLKYKAKFDGGVITFTFIPYSSSYNINITGMLSPDGMRALRKIETVINKTIHKLGITDRNKIISAVLKIPHTDARIVAFVTGFIRKNWPFT